jgi:cytochrome d ubiquinol oxidase subunit I
LRVGGLPDVDSATTPYALEIPKGLSILAFGRPDAEVKGLKEFPRDEWPAVPKVHLAFQLMVGAGTAMALLAVLTLWLRWRKGAWPVSRRLLGAWVLAGPLGVLAMEAGWLVTEWGRQPWVVRGFLRTSEAVTPVPHLAVPFWTFSLVYLFLGAMVAFLLSRQVAGTLPGQEAHPDAPPAPTAHPEAHHGV